MGRIGRVVVTSAFSVAMFACSGSVLMGEQVDGAVAGSDGSASVDGSVDSSLGTDSDAGTSACPADISAAVGASCSREGRSCGGDQCRNPCEFCNVIQCRGGVWVQVEAPPMPCEAGTDAQPIEAGSTCSKNSQCTKGETCSGGLLGTCSLPSDYRIFCISNDGCPSGQTCSSPTGGYCSCSSAAVCPTGWTCDTQLFIQSCCAGSGATCISDNDCCPGSQPMHCTSGSCQ
jgi:hypothetical protein